MSTHERAVEHALLLAGQVLDATTADEAAAAMDRVYTDDVVWEIPGRQLFYTGKEAIKDAYRRLLDSAGDFSVERLDRFATPERVIDDAWVHFKIIGDGFPNAPVPVGSLVTLRLVHIIQLRDGLICRENGYEIWLPGGTVRSDLEVERDT